MQGAAVWYKIGKKAFISTSTAFMSFKCSQIIKCPPLQIVDLPDIWTPDPATPIAFTNNTNCCSSHGNDGIAAEVQRMKGGPLLCQIDGRAIAEEIRSGIAVEVQRMKDATGEVPGLAAILVGQRKDSQNFVLNKTKACEEVGIKSLIVELPDDCMEDEVLDAVSNFNDNSSIHENERGENFECSESRKRF